jgi:hypothetical protein
METVSSTGDIWSTGAFSFESPLKDLLDRGDFTLQELLAEDELLQELRGMHPQLIEFLSTEEAVVGLVEYVIQKEPLEKKKEEIEVNGNHVELQTTIRYPYMACEVICCEINSIIDTLVDGHVVVKSLHAPHKANVQDEHNNTNVEVTIPNDDDPPPRILSLLFSLLEKTPVGDLDDYRAGYFDKILNVLFRKRSKTMSAYMNQDGTRLLQQMMNHLYSHSIMQIVQRLVMPPPSSFLHQNEQEEEEGDDDDDNGPCFFSCGWSELPESIDLLLHSLFIQNDDNNDDNNVLFYKSKSASQILIAVIQNSSLTSRTMVALTTDPILGKLCKTTYTLEPGQEFSRHDSSLTTAMNVLESIVLQLGGYGSVGTALDTSQDDQDESPPAAMINHEEQNESIEMSPAEPQVANAHTLLHHLPNLLQGLSELLQHPATKTWTSPMQFSKSEPLLGMSRLAIVRLVESLVLLANPHVDAVLCQSDCLEICLNLFWTFSWCSMLHQSVANLLVHVFEGANERAQLQEYFIVKCNLLKRLMESFVEETPVPMLSENVLAMQTLNPPSISVQSECGSSVGSVEAAFDKDDSVLPVSDDDVDAAMEQQQQQEQHQDGDVHTMGNEPANDGTEDTTKEDPIESKEEQVKESGDVNEEFEVKSSIPSLRMGCLGHVIIVCQALVHACTAEVNESREEEQDDNEEQEQTIMSGIMRSVDLGEISVGSDQDGIGQTSSGDNEDKNESLEASKSADSAEDTHDDEGTNGQVNPSTSQDSVSNDRVIAQLVNSHPLHDEWKDFITSTLAAETQIQSTPLGGAHVATVESMQSQLPRTESVRAYDFSDEDGDETGEVGSREFFGGEVLDMDDNDLDIAASMMDALNLSRQRESDEADDGDIDGTGNQRHDAVINSFGTVVQNSGASSGDYLFDDPLGGDSRFGAFGNQDDDSSDEEDERGDVTGGSDGRTSSACSSGDEDDTPVMDLFTGNFDEKSGSSGDDQASPQNGTFSDFANFDANFDEAFAAADASKTSSFSFPSSDEDDVLKAASSPAEAVDDSVESLFGTTPPHALLLGDEDEGNDQSASELDPVEKRSGTEDADPTSAINSKSVSPQDEEPSPSTPVSESTPSEAPKEDNESDTIESEPKAQTATPG